MEQSNEPGQELSEHLIRYSVLTNSDIDNYIPKNRAFSPINVLSKKHLFELESLLREQGKSNNLIEALHNAKQLNTDAKMLYLAFALSLFPIQRNYLVDNLLRSKLYSRKEIKAASEMTNIDARTILPAKPRGANSSVLTPLIHSVGINIYGYSVEAENKVWFKPQTSNKWQAGLPLHYVPVTGALSGSIVYLEPNTKYDIKVSMRDQQKSVEQHFLVTTKPNSPPIDPSKIIYLRDFYQGGNLDLRELNISGNASGWAKIVGDDVVIDAGSQVQAALNLGDAEYVLLENITIKGGKRFGIYANQAHHIWINGCDISQFGRTAGDYRRGVGYEDDKAKKPINYDAGIFLRQSGSVVIENCDIYSPNHGANNWSRGHPRGASALLISANHPKPEYAGQYIIRNNRFYGTDKRRFNDVIESRDNVRRHGGFVKDSAIYNNYLAYANDDVIELDGGQSNILLYNNTISQGYCGVSLAPNMQGPSYIFNNDIVNLGDDRGAEWAAFKMGGLFSAPSGKTFIFQNLVDVKANGVATGGLRGDSTFWVETRNNIIRLSSFREQKRGYGIYDPNSFYLNSFLGDFILNLVTRKSETFLASPHQVAIGYTPTSQEVAKLWEGSLRKLSTVNDNKLNNFSYPPLGIATIDDKAIPVGILPKVQ